MARTAWLLLPALLALSSVAAQAGSNTPLSTGEQIRLGREGRRLELKVLENQERMLQYQRDHQRFMEDLRRAPPAEQLRPEIPKMQRNCQLRVYGNKWLNSCR